MDGGIAKSTDKYGNLNNRDPRKMFSTVPIFSSLFFPMNYVPFSFIGNNRENVYVNYACVLKIVKQQ